MARDVAATPHDVVNNYRPNRNARPDVADVWDDIRDVTIRLVLGSNPETHPHARVRIGAVSQFLTWLVTTGVWHPDSGEPVPFSLPMVDHYINLRAKAGFHAASTVRSHLKKVGLSYAPNLWPYEGAAKSRYRRVPPYSPAEQRALWAVAQRLWDEHDVAVAAVMAAGFGAGLDTADLRSARGTDLRVTANGPTFHVTAPARERAVPVADAWADRLTAACDAIGDGLLVGHVNVDTRNMMSRVVYRMERYGPSRLNMQQVRTTWMVDRLTAQVPPTVLMRHAGLRSFSAIDQVLPYVPDVPDDETDRLMRNSR